MEQINKQTATSRRHDVFNSPQHCIAKRMTVEERGANSASKQNNAVVAVQPKKRWLIVHIVDRYRDVM